MDKEELKYEDLLKKLILNSSPDMPSDDFADRVMDKIMASPALAPVKKSFYLNLRTASPFFLLGIFCLIIILTSDFPFMNQLPGKEYFTTEILPYFTILITGFKTILATKYFSIALMGAAAGLLLVLIEQLFSRKATQNHTA